MGKLRKCLPMKQFEGCFIIPKYYHFLQNSFHKTLLSEEIFWGRDIKCHSFIYSSIIYFLDKVYGTFVQITEDKLMDKKYLLHFYSILKIDKMIVVIYNMCLLDR